MSSSRRFVWKRSSAAASHARSAGPQHLAAIRDQITDRDLDIVESDRALAQFTGSLADVSIACWRAKYDFRFWRR